jgi:hypothetical protein
MARLAIAERLEAGADPRADAAAGFVVSRD